MSLNKSTIQGAKTQIKSDILALLGILKLYGDTNIPANPYASKTQSDAINDFADQLATSVANRLADVIDTYVKAGIVAFAAGNITGQVTGTCPPGGGPLVGGTIVNGTGASGAMT